MLVASVDGPNRRIILDISTQNMVVHPIDVYKEVRALRRLDETLRRHLNFMTAFGNISKGSGKFTERYVRLNSGARIVPFDADHAITVNGVIITDDGQEGIACFDRSSLSVNTQVDINYVPPQVEIIDTGSNLATVESKLDAQTTLIKALQTGGGQPRAGF